MENQNNSSSDFTVTASLRARYTDEQLAQIKAAVAQARLNKATRTPRAANPERAAKLEQYRAGVEERKAARAVKRAEREVQQANFVPHIGRITKAAANLPELSGDAQAAFEVVTSLSIADRSCVAAHLNHLIREAATLMSLTTNLVRGQRVQVTGGDTRFLGMVGTLTEVRRIRCFVDAGLDKQLYLLTSDVSVLPTETEDE